MSNKLIGILDPEGNNNNPFTNEPYSDKYKELGRIWSKYPAYEDAENTIKLIKDNQIILITSGTGSGKTVLIPKYVSHVFDYNGHIAITLPKQIIAKSSAIFAAETLDVKLGKHVGYKYKGSDKKAISDNTNLAYVTDGTIVSQLMKDPLLKKYDAVIIDEAHERKIQIDFLLYLLKKLLKERSDFKLIIMSATVNEQVFIDYFKNQKFVHIDIGGKTNYPIKSIFLDKDVNPMTYISKGFEIIENLIKTTKTGDILFFVSSIMDTFEVCKKLALIDTTSYCAELYAGMNIEKEQLAQHKTLYLEKTGKKRKVVIATNVAESSLTIDGIEYVIDGGYEIFNSYDPVNDADILEKKIITQAQAKQRMGRAGRTGPGTCYHLYTKNMFENRMPKYPRPSIQFANIYGECLGLLNLENVQTVDVMKTMLNDFIDPPRPIFISSAIKKLTKLGLVENDTITNLGKIIAQMNFEPMHSLVLYKGYSLKCLSELVIIFLMIEITKGNIGELFNAPQLKTGEKVSELYKKYLNAKDSLAHKYGDHMTYYKIYEKYNQLRDNENKLNDWLFKNFIKKSILEKVRNQFHKTKGMLFNLFETLDMPKYDIDKYDYSIRVMSAILFGFKDNIVKYDSKSKTYQNKTLHSLQPAKESWMSKEEKNELLYGKIMITSSRINLTMCSIIPNSAKELLDSII
jgi:HrpA-like RNA helicase